MLVEGDSHSGLGCRVSNGHEPFPGIPCLRDNDDLLMGVQEGGRLFNPREVRASKLPGEWVLGVHRNHEVRVLLLKPSDVAIWRMVRDLKGFNGGQREGGDMTVLANLGGEPTIPRFEVKPASGDWDLDLFVPSSLKLGAGGDGKPPLGAGDDTRHGE
jgi:hypothetical protein